MTARTFYTDARQTQDDHRQGGQSHMTWGDDVVGLLAQDLRARGDLGRGFSRRNLFYMRKFAALWSDAQIVQPLAAAGPTTKCCSTRSGMRRTSTHGTQPERSRIAGSRRQLRGQIDLKLHLRTGAATANYAARLGDIDGRAALAVTKDPYVLDFIDLAEDAKERQLEDALVREIPRFLRELGVGFAYYGRQQPLEIGGREFFLDLLFYHHWLCRFVVIDSRSASSRPSSPARWASTSTPSTTSCATATMPRASV